MRELLWPFKKMDFWLALGSTFLLSSLETIVQWFAYFYFRDIVSNYDIFGWVSLDNSETAGKEKDKRKIKWEKKRQKNKKKKIDEEILILS